MIIYFQFKRLSGATFNMILQLFTEYNSKDVLDRKIFLSLFTRQHIRSLYMHLSAFKLSHLDLETI